MNMWFIYYTCKLCFVLSETFLRMLLGWDWKQLLPSAPANPRADWSNGGPTPADSDGNRKPEAWARKASWCQNIFRKRNWNVLQINRWGRKVNINLWKTWKTSTRFSQCTCKPILYPRISCSEEHHLAICYCM